MEDSILHQLTAVVYIIAGLLVTPIMFVALDFWAGIRKARQRGEDLRSDKMQHEPDTKIYSDFLRNHSGFCYKYFSRISEEFPEYLLALKEIMSK